jgi:hypothetical protein
MRFFLSALIAACVYAQKPLEPPLTLDVLTEGLRDPVVVDVPGLTREILARGIDFNLGKQELGALLNAAANGKRAPDEVAALIAAAQDNCQKCRARFLTPLSLEELLTMLRRGHDDAVLLQEVKTRRVKELDVSEGTANVLRAAGAKDALVAFLVPDDKVPTIPLIGYNTVELKHAEDYDPTAPEGWLKVMAELPAKSTSEFVFKHNGLFERAMSGEEPTTLGAYFNKPAPRNVDIDHLDFTSNLESGEIVGGDEKRSGGLLGKVKGKPKNENAKDAPVFEVAYLDGDRDGRHAFRILLANKQRSPQQYSFTVRWRVLTAPKAPAPAPAKPARRPKK